MRKGGTIAVAAAVAALVCAGAFLWSTRTPTPCGVEVDGAPQASADAEEGATPTLRRPAPAPAAESTGPRALVSGVVLRAGRPTRARVEVRVADPRAQRLDLGSATALLRLADGPLDPPTPLAVAAAGDDGRFGIDASGTGYLEVRAVAEDGADGLAFVQVRAAGARVECLVEIAEGAFSLRGRIAFGDGRPFRGFVYATRDAHASRYRHRPVVHADAGGRFVLDGLAAGRVTVIAFSPGEVRASWRDIDVSRSRDLVLIVDEATAPLVGRVVHEADGSGVGGATVMVGLSGANQATFVTRTAPDGAFTLPWDRRGYLAVAADGYAAIHFHAREVADPFEVRLARTATLVGRVLRASDDTPVAGARVRALRFTPGEYGVAMGEAVSGAEGRYEIAGLPPCQHVVVATAPGLRAAVPADHFQGNWQPFRVELAPGAKTEKDVRLDAAASVRGRVIDADGAPVGRALVEPEASDDPLASLRGFRVLRPESVVSADDGTYAFDGVATGVEFSVAATAPGFARTLAGPVTPALGESVTLDVHLEHGRTLEVRVVADGSDSPLAGATVTSRNGSGEAMSATTGAEGSAMLRGLGKGELVVDVRLVGRAPRTVAIAEDATSVVVRLGVGVALEGRVLASDGSPVGGASVFASQGLVVASTRTDPNGAFRIDDLSDAAVVVEARALSGENPTSAKTEARPGTPVVLRLEPSEEAPASTSEASSVGRPRGPSEFRGFALRVVDAAGRLVPAAATELRASNGTSGSVVHGGRATWEARPRSDAVVAVWGARDAYGRILPLAPARVSVRAGASEAVVTLGPDVSIEGRVLLPDGTAATGARVFAAWPDRASDRAVTQPSSGAALAIAYAAPDGTFRLNGLADEPVALLVEGPPGTAPLAPVPTRGGARGVVIRLRAGVAAHLVVLGPDGPIAGAKVSIVEAGRMPSIHDTRTTSADGSVRWSMLDPSKAYRLAVEADPAHVRFLASHWKPHDDVLHLPRAVALAGTVTGVDGLPVVGARVEARVWPDEPTSFTISVTKADGRFRFPHAPEGDLLLRVSTEADLGGTDTIVRVAPDGADVRVVYAPQGEWRLRVEGWREAGGRADVYATVFVGPAGGDIESRTLLVGADGTFTVRGAREGVVYTVWVPRVDPDSYVLATSVAYEPQGTTLVPSQGASIVGRVLAPADAGRTTVGASRDGLLVFGVVGADGRYVIPGVPPGTWRVWGHTSTPSGAFDASASAEPGGTADLEFKPVPGFAPR